MLGPEQLTLLLRHIAPDAIIQAVEPLHLGFSNRSFRMAVIRPDIVQERFIVKRYSHEHEHVFGLDVASRARVEQAALNFLRANGIPCPELIFCDPEGAILGAPILITRLLPGAQILANPANRLWAERAPAVAALLASIHKLHCPSAVATRLPDATSQATWFLRGNTIPGYMLDHPDGASIWAIVKRALARLQPPEPALVHGDYWSGNILWDNGQISGLLDWENAAFGPPGFDVAYCRMEMVIDGMDDAAETFLRTYETLTGKQIINLGLYELAVAVQPMWQRAPFLTTAPYQERFRRFVTTARESV